MVVMPPFPLVLALGCKDAPSSVATRSIVRRALLARKLE